MELVDLKTKAGKLLGQKELLEKQIVTYKEELSEASNLLQAQEEAQALIQLVARETQEQIQAGLQDIVQSALDAVFPGIYKFIFEFVEKRGRTETSMYLEKDGTRMNPMDSNGGGVVDIIATTLRVACWTLSKSDNVMVKDEPFKFLSAKYRPLLGEIIRQVSHKLGLQFIIVTHDPEIINVADRVFHVDQIEGKSFIDRVFDNEAEFDS